MKNVEQSQIKEKSVIQTILFSMFVLQRCPDVQQQKTKDSYSAEFPGDG